jgi:virulence-associated protein VagC
MAKRAEIFEAQGDQAVRLPDEYRFEDPRNVWITRQGSRVILEPGRRQWSRAFIDLAGSAPDFPYPEEPHDAEPGPAGLCIESWRLP